MFKRSLVLGALFCSQLAFSESVPKDLQPKVDAKVKLIEGWASDPKLIELVKAYNASPPAEAKAMNQDKWKSASVVDPTVKSIAKSGASEFLKAKRDDSVTEAFVSGADGTKIGFLSKPSNWSHKGKPKHDVPMSGKNWQGDVEVDESTGAKQVQVAVPIKDAGKTIGSLVVGVGFANLK